MIQQKSPGNGAILGQTVFLAGDGYTFQNNRNIPACQPPKSILTLLDQAETFMAAARRRGDDAAWVDHCLVWFELHALAYGQGVDNV